MRRGRGKLGLMVAVAAALAGVCLAIALASGSATASASGTYIWTPYDISSEGGNAAAADQPSFIEDPNGTREDEVVNSPSGHDIVWVGDGQVGGIYNVDATGTSGVVSSGSPSTMYDPQSGDLLIFTDTSNGDLYALDRNASGSFQPFNISGGCCDANGTALPVIVGDPSAILDPGSNTIAVAAATSAGDLDVFSRSTDGVWAATDVTSATSQVISGDPVAIPDPSAAYLDVFADTSSGHLIDFNDQSGSWQSDDLTSQFGGQTITGYPTPTVQNGELFVFAEAPGGDLIEWQRPVGGGDWQSQNLSTITGGPAIAGTPAVVTDPAGGFDVFAEGANEHLIQYAGSGSTWTATDLTTSAGGPTLGAPPAATVSSQTGNLVVYVSSPTNQLIELERTAAPAPVAATTTTTVTQTVVSSPPPTRAKRTVKVTVLTDWKWFKRESELRAIRMGKLRTGEGLTLSCRGPGTGKAASAGCPYATRAATGPAAVRRLIAAASGTRYRVGVVLTLTVSEPGLKPEQARFTIRASRVPKVAR